MQITGMKPVGHYVLIDVAPVEEKSAGGIIMNSQEDIERETKGRDIGRIIDFGPIAYKGFGGCTCPADWGVKVGDLVEFNRYDGKIPRLAEERKEYKHYRYINDNDIIAVLEEA